MKFIRKNKLDEGLFNTKAEMQKRIERENSLSDEETVAKIAVQVYQSAKKRLVDEAVKDYLSNYGNDYNCVNESKNVFYCFLLSPLFENENSAGFNGNSIKDFDKLRDVDISCNDGKKLVHVDVRYRFDIPKDWYPKHWDAVSHTPERDDLKICSADMTARISQAMKKAASRKKNAVSKLDASILTELAEYEYEIGKVTFFDGFSSNDILIDLRLGDTQMVYNPKRRDLFFRKNINVMLEKFNFGCRTLTLAYEDWFALGNWFTDVRSPAAVGDKFSYKNILLESGFDLGKVIPFVVKNHISGSEPLMYSNIDMSKEGIERRVETITNKYTRGAKKVEICWQRYYKYVIQDNQLVESVAASPVPVTLMPMHQKLFTNSVYNGVHANANPIQISCLGMMLTYEYFGDGEINLLRINSQDIDDIKDGFDVSDNVAVDELTKLGKYAASIIESIKYN